MKIMARSAAHQGRPFHICQTRCGGDYQPPAEGRQGESVSGKASAKSGFEIQAGEVTVMQSRYELVIYWSKDDQCFVVEVPELPGCMADGESYQDAVKNAELVIEEWIATAREHGRSIPEPAGRLMYA
jgi:predicted RNase H-like HicB family nuclease